MQRIYKVGAASPSDTSPIEVISWFQAGSPVPSHIFTHHYHSLLWNQSLL